MDTCGTVDQSKSLHNSIYMECTSPSGSTQSCGPEPVSAPGGQYRLCWCSVAHGCATQVAFNTDVGSLTVIGPRLPFQQHRTCISGRTCVAEHIQGVWLSSMDRMLILETCGTSSIPPRLLGTVGLPLNMDQAQTMADFALVDNDYLVNGSFNTQHVHITVAGGQYRMCWLAGGLGLGAPGGPGAPSIPFALQASWPWYNGSYVGLSPERFQVDMGSLTIIGPSPFRQDNTCVSGHTCGFGNMLGHFLSVNDHFSILETCGVTGVIPRIPNGAILPQVTGSYRTDPTSNNCTESNVSSCGAYTGIALSFSSVLMTASAGTYRLCWCAADSTCTESLHFRTDMGALTVLGVSNLGSHLRTCVSGHTCPSMVFWMPMQNTCCPIIFTTSRSYASHLTVTRPWP
jgi:hypothetical protein